MPFGLWSLREIKQYKLADGFVIQIVTDDVAHLWLRWTGITPQTHTIPVYRRGIWMHGDLYFCFVKFLDIEQEEVGDTLIHTFIWRGWTHCETHWFYFHGTIATIPSPSTSPLFFKHFEYVPPFPERKFHCDTGGVYYGPIGGPGWLGMEFVAPQDFKMLSFRAKLALNNNYSDFIIHARITEAPVEDTVFPPILGEVHVTPSGIFNEPAYTWKEFVFEPPDLIGGTTYAIWLHMEPFLLVWQRPRWNREESTGICTNCHAWRANFVDDVCTDMVPLPFIDYYFQVWAVP